MIFYDTETCGLHGMAVLLQYAVDDGPIHLYNFWTNPIKQTLELIEWMMNHEDGLVGFNLAFDHFHLCKIYTTFRLYDDHDICPIDDIEILARLEKVGRDGPCLKPVKSMDLFLHARKGPYQSTMDRHDIRIKRVPAQLAWRLAEELEARIPLKDIYFARRANKTASKWKVLDIHDDEGNVVREFKDVVLKFAPSSALKALAVDALNIEEDIDIFGDIAVDDKFNPNELGYAPFAEALGIPGNWNWTWPDVIEYHIDHWEYNKRARKYAEKDVEYTRDLYYYFGSPELGDNDSELACMVAAVRWRGFRIDKPKIKDLKEKATGASKEAPTAASYVKKYIWPYLSEEEKAFTEGSTKKVVLESIRDNFLDDCDKCDGEGCKDCKYTGEVKTEASIRAEKVLKARVAEKEIDLYNKLLKAGRFHASFKIIGTLSSRMSGADGLNPQGIKSTKEVRSAFPLSWGGYSLSGGDFESFEVAIAVAVYDDKNLEAALNTYVDCPCKNNDSGQPRQDCKECGGTGKVKQKIHGLFAEVLFPEETYESILATKGTENDLYTEGKRGVFSQVYGGNEFTLMTRLGLTEDRAKSSREEWLRRNPNIAKKQRKITEDFSPLSQPGGLGSKVIWREPKDYIESMLGFRRYFTLENMICKALFDLASDPPKHWNDLKIKVRRRQDRGDQTGAGATRSALFGAAFAIQGANVRAAINHEIQSTGAEITKDTQRQLWNIQPSGVDEFRVMPLNVHDEILTPIKPEYVEEANEIINTCVEKYKPKVPMIAIDWSDDLETWADK